MFFSILLAGLNSSREKMVIKRVESFPIKHTPHPSLILGVGGGVALGGRGGAVSHAVLGRGPCAQMGEAFHMPGLGFHAAVGGSEEFWGAGREVEHEDPCSLLPPPCGWSGDRSEPGCLLEDQG